MATLFDLGLHSVVSSTGATLAGAKLYFYAAGTTTPLDTYTDATLAVANANPVVADANGRFSQIYLKPAYYKYVLKTASGTTLVTRDNLRGGHDDLVSVKESPYSAAGDGVTDDTAAIQAAIDSGAKAVFLPAGTYLVSSLLMPNVLFFTLYGEGPATVIKQKAGASGALIRWSTAAMVYNEHTVRNIGINGNVGSQHCIDTSGAGGVTLNGIYITDVPVGKSGIYVNGAASTYTHDPRIDNVQIYSNTAGHSGIRFGPLCADTMVSNFIMNGNFVTNYCLYYDVSALTVRVSNSHPYNASVNILKLAGSNSMCAFNNCTFDNATDNLVSITAASSIAFTECHFEAIKSGKDGLNIVGTTNGVTLFNCKWDGVAGAASCLTADANSHSVFVFGGSIPSVGNFTAPFTLSGNYSSARGLAGYFDIGLQWHAAGVQAAAQAQATTQYLGIGSSATEVNAEYTVPLAAKLTKIFISADNTPAAGQTRTYQARINGSNVGTALVLANGDTSGTITLNQSVTQYSRLTISSVYSATSGSATSKWSAEFLA